jgi:hypothetical protein
LGASVFALRDQGIAPRDQSLAHWTELAVVVDYEHITRIAVIVLLHTHFLLGKGSCNTVRRVQGDCPIRPTPGTHRVDAECLRALHLSGKHEGHWIVCENAPLLLCIHILRACLRTGVRRSLVGGWRYSDA